jgi:hypothetical protein
MRRETRALGGQSVPLSPTGSSRADVADITAPVGPGGQGFCRCDAEAAAVDISPAQVRQLFLELCASIRRYGSAAGHHPDGTRMGSSTTPMVLI